MIIDDDTFIFENSFFSMLNSLSEDPMRFSGFYGRGSTFSGCGQVLGKNGWAIDNKTQQTLNFAHGGSGILLTNRALHSLSKKSGNCSARYASCWAGDIALGLCMYELGIPLQDRIGEEYVFWGGSHLNPHDEDVLMESSCKIQVDKKKEVILF